MAVESLCYWALVWVCLELSRVQYAALQLSLTLTLILTVVILVFVAELDLLALVLLSTYASVFIALALIMLHFGPFWSRAVALDRGASSVARYLILVVGVSVCGVFGSTIVTHPAASNAAALLGVLWQDLALDARVRVGGYVGLTHWLFFRFFIIETLGLNIYLFIGLVVALVLLAFRYTWVDGAAAVRFIMTERSESAGRHHGGDRLRLLARFRRQVRRTNASRLRHPRT